VNLLVIIVLFFWPNLFAGMGSSWSSFIHIALGSSAGTIIGFVIILTLKFFVMLKRSLIKFKDVYGYPANIYISRSGLGFISAYRISLLPWNYYLSIESIGKYYFIQDRFRFTVIIPSSTFRSAQESTQFESLIRALITGKPIDNLIQPDNSWPPKPSI
jgi:hypothetical protein